MSQWTEAYNWKKNQTIVQVLDTNKNKYHVKSGNSTEIITLEVIKKYEELMANCRWKTWADFKNCAFGLHHITLY